MANKTITIKADFENNAELFWGNFDEAYPVISDKVRDGETEVDAATWESIQSLDGFSDGPDYAGAALVEVNRE